MRAQRKINNILVTGGSGFIGSAFIRYLLERRKSFLGTCVNVDALTYAGNPENLSSIASDARYVFQKGDIRNQSLIEHLCQEYSIDTIIHFAAESHVDRSLLGPQAFVETNIVGTFHLLEVVRRLRTIHFHHVSTDEVFGSLGSDGYFKETTPYAPNSPYSASKASSDHLVRAYTHSYGISSCISNCSNNYGPFHFPEKFIPLMILNAIEGLPQPIYGSGKNVRDWLYVEDHAEALNMLLEYGVSGETYNIGGEAEWSNLNLVYEINRQIAEIMKLDHQQLNQLITFVKDRPGHDLRYAIDCSKIKQTIGWKPSHLFEEGLKKTIEWYISNASWVSNVRKGAYQDWMQLNYTSR